MYFEIPPKEMAAFFTARGYQPVGIRDCKELMVAKLFEAHDLAVVVATTITPEGQRGYGEDAMRCLLKRLSDGKLLWQLTPTKRMEQWKVHLGRKMDLLEALIATVGCCLTCGSMMVPRSGKFGMFWGCSKSTVEQPHQTRDILPALSARILPETRWPSRERK